MKKSISIALCVFLSGCTGVVSLKSNEAFKTLLGEKTLIEDGLICASDSEEGMSIKNQIVWQNENVKCYIGDTVKQLASGDKVVITDIIEVKRLNLFRFQHWYLIGYVPNQSDEIRFFYHWATSTASPDYPDNAREPKWN